MDYRSKYKGSEIEAKLDEIFKSHLQDKAVEITENGVTEVTADAGFTGLSKVVVNTNVASSGGGSGSDIPVIGDGKTYLYINIAEKGRMDVPLYFSQTVANGVTIDWGDGSATQTLGGTGDISITHTYADKGEYVISLNPADGCTLGLGQNSSSYYVLGRTGDYNNTGYMLQAVEIGKGATEITAYAFQECWALSNVIIPMGVTHIRNRAFSMCVSLTNISLPDSITQIGNYAFAYCYNLISAKLPLTATIINDSTFYCCYNLKNIDVPDNVTLIDASAFHSCFSLEKLVFKTTIQYLRPTAFYSCRGMRYIDFSNSTYVTPLDNKNSFSGIASDCKIVVPDSLYSSWIASTNWSTNSIASKIIKKSDWDAQNS